METEGSGAENVSLHINSLKVSSPYRQEYGECKSTLEINPLLCSCLENPRDRGAWRAAVYGVTQSRTRLMRLSRSSSSVGLLHILDTQGMRGENQQLINKSCPSKGFSQTLYFLGGPNMSRYVSSLKQSCTNSERL